MKDEQEKEYILCAAIWFHDGKVHEHQPKNVNNGFVVTGRRHHNCYMTMAVIRGEDVKRIIFPKEVQGFITNLDRFVDRKEGGEIAFKANQSKQTECLFSEDLY